VVVVASANVKAANATRSANALKQVSVPVETSAIVLSVALSSH